MVLNNAISNCLVSTPIVNMLFIIMALRIKRLTITNFSTTPINIPKYPITMRLLAMGMDDCTENIPMLEVTLALNELKSS